MRISAKIDYACRALLELSLHWPNHAPLQINTIAQNRQIPHKFLTQILIHLKQLGYVRSMRGKSGGYLLVRAPRNINLREVVQSFSDTGNDYDTKQKNKTDTFTSIWQEIEEETFKAMQSMTFEEIIKRESALHNVAMFAI
ncbi:MAG: hypothetical protein A3C36_04215 [Omnitrophica WOR_2 bacterium RIFCSPHIGHO2_02_FULL_52_10]|nr:MAG: hypothetical protein A3C36_04215 [Omnitrophica WOR_2 bacterium RIFCSPHIGHO2_02_FULL_52_10]